MKTSPTRFPKFKRKFKVKLASIARAIKVCTIHLARMLSCQWQNVGGVKGSGGVDVGMTMGVASGK